MKEGRATRLSVDLSVIADNARLLRAWTPASSRVMAVVKADAYGHGDVAVAKTALRSGCDGLGVALASEGARLRAQGVEGHILVMGAPEPETAELAVAQGLSQTVFLPGQVRWIAAVAKKLDKPARVQMKLETGMGRIGVGEAGAVRALADVIAGEPWLRLEGAFTHLADADDTDSMFVRTQLGRFEALAGLLRKRWPSLRLHAANSAALLAWPEAAYDWVRPGIALYGAPPVKTPLGLREALRWTTRASLVKPVARGESVGYGRSYTADRDMRVMTLPMGYADGYRRALSNRGWVLVRGRRAPLVGRVCMDQCMADVTEISGVAEGDEVVLLGEQGGERIGADEMGHWAGTISYEILCAIGARVPRVYVGEESGAIHGP